MFRRPESEAAGKLEDQRREIIALLEQRTALQNTLATERAQTVALQERADALAAALDSIDGTLARLPFAWPLDGVLRRSRRLRRRILARIRAFAARRALQRSALFRADWYLARYPDVQNSAADPIDHYVLYGAAEGRDPGPDFSTGRYLAQHVDVLAAGMNPLAHYETVGRAQGRRIFPAAAPAAAPPVRGERPRIVYISGEAATPGHAFRVLRYAEAARGLGCDVVVLPRQQVQAHLAAIAACNLLVIWRAGWDRDIAAAVQAAHAAGARIQFDVDDLMFEPDLARADIIDGIRSQGFSETETAAFFNSVAKVAAAADHTSAPTPFLAERLQRFGKPGFVLPNGFDAAVWRNARRAVRRRGQTPADGLVRIGYPAGTRTHQRDIAIAAGAIAEVLACRPQARLVLFRDGRVPMVDVSEFPALDAVAAQIEWREMVPVEDVVIEMARYDISIAPLELDNPFCEAKSELKFFESALVEVAIVASPTGPFSQAISHGQTGLLAADAAAWKAALLTLVDDPKLRETIGRAGYFAALWRYGPEARIAHMQSLLAQLFADAADTARAFELELHRQRRPRAIVPHIPLHQADILQDTLGDAAMTVLVLLANAPIVKVLDAVDAQTLAELDLIVVDDHASDASARAAQRWMMDHKARFNRLVMIRAPIRSDPGDARNAGFAHAETPFVLPIDADLELPPDLAARCLAVADQTSAAFVGPITGTKTTAVRLSAWAEASGFGGTEEDDGFRRRCAERGLYGLTLPED